MIIPAKTVANYRQGHKTDANDALAVVESTRVARLKLAPLKSVEQQGLQSIQRSRELLVQNRVGLSNHVRGLLMEFGIVIPQGWAALHRRIPEILEDGDNELPDMYRPTLHLLWRRLCELREDIEQLDAEVKQLVKQHAACKELLALEGIGPIVRSCCTQVWVQVKPSATLGSSRRISG
jgi:transposase